MKITPHPNTHESQSVDAAGSTKQLHANRGAIGFAISFGARFAIKGLYWLRDTYNLRQSLPEPFDWASHLGNVYPTMKYGIYTSIGLEILQRVDEVIADSADRDGFFDGKNANAIKRIGVFAVGVAANVFSESGAYDAVFNVNTGHDTIDALYGVTVAALVATFLHPNKDDIEFPTVWAVKS